MVSFEEHYKLRSNNLITVTFLRTNRNASMTNLIIHLFGYFLEKILTNSANYTKNNVTKTALGKYIDFNSGTSPQINFDT